MSLHLEKQASFQAGFLDNFWRQTFHSIPPIPAGIDLAGKTALVTGSNGGLGLECARHFLKLRPSLLILAVRSLQKGEAAAVGLRADLITIIVSSLIVLSITSLVKFRLLMAKR
jgi:hypothetical protein